MKKQILTMALTLGILGVKAQNNNTYQSEASISSGGYSLTQPNDVVVNSSNFLGLCQADSGTIKGFSIVKNDINNGTTISGKIYRANSSATLMGQRILSIGTNYYVLANYNGSGTALLEIAAGTGAVTFAETMGNVACSTRPYIPVDMVYDGSAYIYVLGHVGNTASYDLWVSKFSTAGVLQWSEELVNNNYNEFGQNIYYQNDSSIYIGGLSDTVGGFVDRGLMVQINNSGAILKEKTIIYSYLVTPRMSTFNLVRNGSNLYAVGCAHIGADGIAPIMIEKMDLNMNDVAHSFYDGVLDDFWFPSSSAKISINHSHIIVPGAGLVNLNAEHYVNSFFNLTTTFANANILNSSPPNNSNNYTISTFPYTSTDGYIYTYANDPRTSNGVYFSKGSQDHDYTDNDVAPCDTVYPFALDTNAHVIIAPYTLTVTNPRGDKTCSLSTLVISPSYTYTQNCFYCPSCQKDASTAGVENVTLSNNISVSPNPSSGQFNFAINLPKATNLNFTVMNALGQTVFSKAETNVSNTVISYDFSTLNKGIYFVNIIDSNNNKTVKKIMIE